MNSAKKNSITFVSVCLVACLMLASQAAYATVAGRAQFVNGSIQITSAAGQTSVLQKGDAVSEGDTLTSAKAASAQIRMQDGGLIAVRPDTQLKFDSFKFNGKQDGSERSFFSLFKGGFRAVTGLIGQVNKTNYRITTAASTIGIRGTDHETFVVTADSPLAAVAPIGTYNKVNRGETSMTTNKGTIFVLPNQMGFSGGADQMPEMKPLNTDIFTVADRPTKEAKVDNNTVADRPTKEAKVDNNKKGKEDGKEMRETAAVDNTAKEGAAPVDQHGNRAKNPGVDNTAKEGAAPAAEVASSTGGGIDTNILQLPIIATNGTVDIDLTGKDTSYREVMMSLTDPNAAVTPAAPMLGFYANVRAGMVTDATGNLTQFDMNTINKGGSNNGGSDNASLTLTSGTSVLADAGNDPLTGISWGRWEGGSVTATDRNTGVATQPALAGSLHWIAGPTETAAVTLPVSGTYIYTKAGGTLPTDNLGNVGTLNSATLSANFMAQTVNVDVNVTVGKATMDAAAANVPITQRTVFYADSQMSGAKHLAVTCTGSSCGTSAQGAIAGGFTGAGATGAMMSYGLQNIGAAGTQVISGVAAFHH